MEVRPHIVRRHRLGLRRDCGSKVRGSVAKLGALRRDDWKVDGRRCYEAAGVVTGL